MLTRVSLVQGPSQLIDLVTVFNYRRATECDGPFRDVLLIGGTCGSVRQSFSMTAACKLLAPLWPFAAIIDVHFLEWLYHARVISFTAAARWLQRLVGKGSVGEVCVCRNTQFPNELVLNAFPAAARICYGDCGSIDMGVTWGDRVHSPAGLQVIPQAFVAFPRAWKNSCLDGVTVHVVPTEHYLHVISDASGLPHVERLLQDCTSIGASENILILTSNLTESGVASSPQHENAFYLESLRPLLSRTDRVAIKGHPREMHGQSATLQKHLQHDGFKAVGRIPNSRMPIDLLTSMIKVRRVIGLGSNGSLPFALRQKSEVVVGVSTDLEKRHLKNDAVNGAGQLNSRVQTVMTQQAFAGEFNVVRYQDIAQMPWEYPDFPLLVSPSGVAAAR